MATQSKQQLALMQQGITTNYSLMRKSRDTVSDLQGRRTTSWMLSLETGTEMTKNSPQCYTSISCCRCWSSSAYHQFPVRSACDWFCYCSGYLWASSYGNNTQQQCSSLGEMDEILRISQMQQSLHGQAFPTSVNPHVAGSFCHGCQARKIFWGML